MKLSCSSHADLICKTNARLPCTLYAHTFSARLTRTPCACNVLFNTRQTIGEEGLILAKSTKVYKVFC